MTRITHPLRFFIAPVLLLLLFTTQTHATTFPAGGFVKFEWTGQVSLPGSLEEIYGVHVGDSASLTVIVADDPPYAVQSDGSRYHVWDVVIQAGQLTAYPSPVWYEGVVTPFGSLRIKDDYTIAAGVFDTLQIQTAFVSAPYNLGGMFYAECLAYVFLDSTAFNTELLPLNTPDTSILPPNFYHMEISDGEFSIALVSFETFTVTHYPAAADVNADAIVNVLDVLAVINAFGPCKSCIEDVTQDGMVDISDLLQVISAWGN